MRSITFEIPGRPVPKARHRAIPYIDKTGKAKLRAYTDERTENAEAAVRGAFLIAARRIIKTAGPVRLDLRFDFEIPRSWPKWRRELALETRIPHLGVPDLTNLTKLVEDGLNSVAWSDDAQVCQGSQDKGYGPEAKTVVTITYLEEAQA